MAIPTPPKIEPIELPPEPGLLRGWGIKLEITLVRFALRVWNSTYGRLFEARDNATNYFLEKLSERVRPILIPHLDRIDSIPGLPEDVKHTIAQLRGTEPITATGIAIGLAMSALMGLLMGTLQPFIRLGAYQSEVVAHSSRMSPSEAFASWRRDGISHETYKNQFLHGGWSDELREGWEAILAPMVSVGDISTIYVRNEIGEAEYNTELAKRGYKPEEIEHIKTLLKVIPPIPDIIRMAVREAFTPDIVRTFQLHAELPGDFVSWAAKQGLSREWAEAYWASHWQLPPLNLGYEMLHRREINDSEMQMLIKAHDVSPFWRDKLLNISYKPYTRVDVRRMYATGTIGKEEVYWTYRDLGYDHERATNLTDFTVSLANATERDLTKSDVLFGYEVGYFSPGESDDLLQSLGYDPEEAAFYLAKTDFKRWQKTIKETVKYLQQKYILNQIDQGVVYAELGKLNLPAEQMNRYILEWDIKKNAKVKRLTAERLEKFRKMEVIGDSEFANEMSGLGYNDKYIGWYLEAMKKG